MGVGRMGIGRDGRWQQLEKRRVWSGYDFHKYPQWVSISLQDLVDILNINIGSNIRSLSSIYNLPLAPFHHSWIYMVSKKHTGKSDQLILTSRGSEYAYLLSVGRGNSISRGNKWILVCMWTGLISLRQSHIHNNLRWTVNLLDATLG